MAQVVVREIGDETVNALKSRARRHKRSLEAEIRVILSETARLENAQKIWAAIDRFHAKMKRSGRHFADSAALVREDRRR